MLVGVCRLVELNLYHNLFDVVVAGYRNVGAVGIRREEELEALHAGALRVLRGEETAHVYR